MKSSIGCIFAISKNRRFKAEDQILVFSDPRGGSTWLSEIINTIPNTAIIWEPLHLTYIEDIRKFNFGWRQYIPEDTSWPEVRLFFEKVLSGRMVNEWTMSYLSIKEYFFAKEFIIKFCRGNMLLPWITRNFNFKYKPVYLIRHPFAVVNSQLRQGGWDQKFRKFKVPDIPYNDVFTKHRTFLESLGSKEEQMIAIWCISNAIPLNHHANNKRWITVFYEDLLLHPEKEIRRIFEIWGKPIPNGLEKAYGQKSRTTLDENINDNPKTQLSRWERELTIEQKNKMQQVLDYFRIHLYSDKSLLPRTERIHNL